MLYLYLNKEVTSEYVAQIDEQFVEYCEESWFTDDIIKVLEKYEKVRYLGRCRFDSPIIGVIDADGLSCTIKTIISACNNKDLIHPCDWLGYDSKDILQELSNKYDMTFTLNCCGFKFNKSHKIFVKDWNEIIDGSTIYKEITDRDCWDIIDEGLRINY